MWAWLLLFAVVALPVAENAGAGAARLVCYAENSRADGFSECTHLVYAGNARGDKLDGILKEFRKSNPRLKIILRVAEVDKDLRTLLKSKHVQGLEINDAHKSLNRTSVLEKVEAAKSALTSSGGGPLFLALPAHPELLAKYYDLRTLVKKVDLMMVQTHALGLVKKMTYHPSRLSGLWDMMNTDSVVDLVVGLGVPASKVVISLPATARQFTLLNETLSTPGSPTVEDEPKEIDQAELCRQLQKGRWTLERDQDLSAPYAFKNKIWVSFEDASSVDVKGKYARVRGLAGLALHKADRDVDTPCGPTLKASLSKVLNQQSRAPRAAVLRSLEHEILSAPGHVRALDALQVSPYRITQVVDSDGVIHSIREDTRTEFSCSRQGYFVHPRSCARFYRCVKFDQYSPEYTVFEFDCPAGLAFDSRYEVCVWPGSLPHSQACPGSSEIAPVPQTRFICPEHEGYYADPENCRWFFACLDHGKSPLTAYEFRCPFGLGFDADKLKCEWPWLVPACGNIARYEAEAYGFSGAILTGAAGFQGQTADDVNIAAHQSLVSGAALDNLVGIQGGFLTKDDALDANFIASQELAGAAGHNLLQGYDLAHGQALDHGVAASLEGQALGHGIAYQAVDGANLGIGLVQPTNYNDQKYTSGSLILDDYRLPTKSKTGHGKIQNIVASHRQVAAAGAGAGLAGQGQQAAYTKGYDGYSSSTFSLGSEQKNQYQSGAYEDNTGAYVHDPTGDYAEPYRHESSPAVPYIHDDSPYKHTKDYYDQGKYVHSTQSGHDGKYTGTDGRYVDDNNGQYVHDHSGDYVESGRYKAGYSGAGSYVASSGGAYKSDYYGASTGAYKADFTGSYTGDNSGAYVHDDSGKYEAGVYRDDGHIGSYSEGASRGQVKYQGGYSQANADKYLTDSKLYTGASHVLTAGAVNVGLVGKTTLVDVDYNDQNNYHVKSQSSFGHQTLHPGHVSLVSQPAVSINHIGTDGNNLDGYNFVTTPTSSGVPTTATPFAVTTSLPVVTSYKTTFVPQAPKSSIKQVFGYTQPAVTYVQPTVVAVPQVTPLVQVTDHNQGFNYQFESKDYSSRKGASASQSSVVKSESSGYDYSKPSIQFEEGVTYTTAAPAVVSTYRPQGFGHSQQTLHKVESVGFQYSTPIPVTEEPFKKLVAYTTGAPVTTFGAKEYRPQAYSHQTIHKVEASNYPSAEIGAGYEAKVTYEAPKVVQYTTVQPAVSVQPVVSVQPQIVGHQTLHTVDASQVNAYSQANAGSFSHQSSGSYSGGESGYTYEHPAVQFQDVKTVQYSTPAPIAVSTYRPQSYSQQTIHKVENHVVPVSSTPLPSVAVSYQAPVTVYKNPILKYTEEVTPVVYEKPSHRGQAYSHQTIHKVEDNKAYTPSLGIGAVEYTKSVTYEQPQIYSTVQPALAIQPAVSVSHSSAFSHQTQHKVDASRVNAYSENADAGYVYEKPSIQFEPIKTVQYSTPAPAVVSTYRPQSYSHQTIHKVETQKVVPVSSTVTPIVDYSYKQADVSTYENPIFKYTQKVTPVTYVQPTAAVVTPTYQPIVQQQVSHIVSQPVQYESQQNLHIGQEGYSYSQPEIQRNVETSKAANSYSDASVVSHQTFHLSSGRNQYESGKGAVIVSTTPSTVAYEDHYVEYEAQKNLDAYKAPEYIPPKTDYQYTVSSTATPIVQQSAIFHKTNDEYDYKPIEYSQQYDSAQDAVSTKQVSFSTSHISQPQKVESVHISSFPGTKVATNYNQATYQSPEIQVAYKSEEYLPPVVSTVVTPIVTSTYRPRTYSTVSTTKEYLPPAVDNTYLPPSTTARPYYKSTTPAYHHVESTTAFQASEYLPPAEESGAKLVNFESFGFDNGVTASAKINPYQDFSVPKVVPTVLAETSAPVRKQNIVVETAKSHLLGFGTVGPDAGLVSPVTYTTAAPVVVSTTSRPIFKSTTHEPSYKFVQSTTEYQAPEYLPPSEQIDTNINYQSFGYKNSESLAENVNYNAYDNDAVVVSTAAPKRKQNLVVETAKTHLLGFGTVGPDAGLVSPVTYTTAAPAIVSSSEYSLPPQVTSTYAPIEQGLFEVTPSSVPIRRTKPKVAVVTKINDFNPLLVRKLGAVCSCQSPVLTLKGRRPVVKEQEVDDYSNSYSNGGDNNNNQYILNSERLQTPTVTVTPIVTSTFNPIIVPDDSFYQDYHEPIQQEVVVTPKKEIYLESVSSTPIPVSSTEKVYTIRPRIKPVTVAPTYKTVILNQEVAPVASITSHDAAAAVLDSPAFDRYGPGGWRSRDETLQGSVDCQRAGLFRHPKQCNKFYACRWDCTKQRFTLHVFNCPIQLSFDSSIGACNWPSQGPACQGDTLLTNTL
ncbi:hypothetical protein O3G_MSEX005797 [Manduca sexta]|uniref:Uncharacterized protein n=1 Tax=Manduca sexta TaxID=7130 RepID=A0A921Z0A6_MANSE|nr:hypothetical protein O3G_MSEX005797 [Manduca sexta]